MSESYASLQLERQGPVATLWMNRPEVFNAFNEVLIDDLRRACAALEQDASVRVVVLAGRGKHFSAGADLHWMQRAAGYGEVENLADARAFAGMLQALAGLSKPTIARVQGAALGGGTGLTAACDMAVASEDAVFSTSEVRFGIIPAVISPYVLRAIGPRQALRYFQSAERIPARRAEALGLVHEVVPRDQLDEAVAALVAGVAGRPIDAALAEDTAQRIARQRATAEAREGIVAFLDKRPAAWVPS
jgi:methylglutaconyl-CoA hydratase